MAAYHHSRPRCHPAPRLHLHPPLRLQLPLIDVRHGRYSPTASVKYLLYSLSVVGEGWGEVTRFVMHLTRILRRNLTPWELKLWLIVKNRGIKNAKFRRQVKIGPYVVDFLCPAAKLIIELDGGHHGDSDNQIKDQIRQKYLENLGYKVLRFWNNEISENLDGVVLKITEHL